MPDLTQSEIIDLLRQHVDSGCESALAEAPVDHYAPAPQVSGMAEASGVATGEPHSDFNGEFNDEFRAEPVQAQAPAVARPVTPPANDAAGQGNSVELAEAAATGADTLDALADAMRGFDACALKATAKNTVFADGRLAADGQPKIMLVGEAPGQDEDREGRPFVGVSGQLLDTMLAAIGLTRDENLYISNIVPWRPPGNRTPSLNEIAVCKPFITRHIELAQPDILLLVGNIANKALLDTQTGITKLRGQWQNYQAEGRDIAALPLLHPAYVLRRPETKANVWADLCALKQKIMNA